MRSLLPNHIHLFISTSLLLATSVLSQAQQRSWPGFRGSGNSLSTASNLPLQWSDEENIAWSVDLEGYGQSSPVIWESHVYVTSAQGEEKDTMRVDCFDLQSGKLLWHKTLAATQKVKKNKYVSFAAPTPVVDDNHVYAFFESGDIIAIDHSGETQWTRSLTKDYGDFLGNHGVGSSTALSSTGLIILIDHSGPGYLLCLDPKTGKNVWKIDREKRVSWSSPIVVKNNNSETILISSNGIAEAYDAANGKQLWKHNQEIEGNTVASPTATGELVIIGSSAKDQSRAIHLTNGKTAWIAEDSASSFGSPLVYQDLVYFVNRSGIAFCNDLKTGKLNWSLRLPTSTWASPISCGNHLYFFSNNGETTILQAGNATEPIKLGSTAIKTDDRIYGVAAVDHHLVFRMETRVVCVAAAKRPGEF